MIPNNGNSASALADVRQAVVHAAATAAGVGLAAGGLVSIPRPIAATASCRHGPVRNRCRQLRRRPRTACRWVSPNSRVVVPCPLPGEPQWSIPMLAASCGSPLPPSEPPLLDLLRCHKPRPHYRRSASYRRPAATPKAAGASARRKGALSASADHDAVSGIRGHLNALLGLGVSAAARLAVAVVRVPVAAAARASRRPRRTRPACRPTCQGW